MFRGVIGRVLVTLPTKENEPAEEKIGEEGGKDQETGVEAGADGLESEA